MSAPLQTALPYGIRDIKITPYIDALGTMLGTVSVDLPYAQTMSFAEAEETDTLRGDDRDITMHGKGATVKLTLEAGGISLNAWKVLNGGTLVEEGVAPNRVVSLRKRATDIRPWWKAEGQSISDSGGDLHAIIYRCKLDGDLKGDFKDGSFFVTSTDAKGYPLLDDSNDLLYEFRQNEQRTAITLVPQANPLPSPQNVVPGAVTTTTVALDWDDVVDATTYKVEQSVSPYSTWTSSTATITDSSASVTGLTTATAYKFRVKAVIGGNDSGPSAPTGVVTTS